MHLGGLLGYLHLAIWVDHPITWAITWSSRCFISWSVFDLLAIWVDHMNVRKRIEKFYAETKNETYLINNIPFTKIKKKISFETQIWPSPKYFFFIITFWGSVMSRSHDCFVEISIKLYISLYSLWPIFKKKFPSQKGHFFNIRAQKQIAEKW